MTKPAPLVPADVDLSGLEYMPLYIAKLKASKSWLMCKRRPELAYYLLNLWMRAWQERPAGSIEADDDILADAAGCSTFEQWLELKSDVMRGWKLCSDGRYYLPSQVEMVRRGWSLVQTNKRRGKAGAAARWGKHDESLTDAPSMPDAYATDAKQHGREGGREGGKERNGAFAPAKARTHVGTCCSCTRQGTEMLGGASFCAEHAAAERRTSAELEKLRQPAMGA